MAGVDHVRGVVVVLAVACCAAVVMHEPGDSSPRSARPIRLEPAAIPATHWTLVPGIGPRTAQELDQSRRLGHFKGRTGEALDDALLQVRGVGRTTLARAAPYIDPGLPGTDPR